ncbi:Trichodiene oxygenase [Cytospora mali]|uniref:Trichodiene oxygenase n=1 Tax=Cytospora mali TaxID=578113 RepID=A0A194VKW5_CYTMA|nr:Trichodiene oxygenase [Valsa mali]
MNHLSDMVDSMEYHTSAAFLTFAGVAAAFALSLLYRLALPKPLPGIPYNRESARRILGDVPAITSHMAQTEGGTFITYLMKTMKTLDAPLIQVFIRPFSKPLLILGDFPEAHDMLVRRKEFDRSHTLGDLVLGLAPDHHIHLPTDTAWKVQRRLVQDLMTPSFLHNIAAPVIYQQVNTLIDLWHAKSRIADGRPWAAGDDINNMALDAVTAFAFGEGFEHNATGPALDAVLKMDASNINRVKHTGQDDPVDFPVGQVDEALQATLDLTETVGKVQGNPAPSLMWRYITNTPKVKKAIKIKEDYIMKELRAGVERLQQAPSGKLQSAIDQMIVREMSLAEKDGRSPDFFSRVMIDETFGFVFAGHETTSTTICWALKHLADNPVSQSKLRDALERSHVAATSAARSPTIQEITSTPIPYLDATMEETLRCAGTAPVVDRVATVDTELLGHHVPKGTVVTCLVTGPSMITPGFDIVESRRSHSSQAAIKEGRHRSWDVIDMSIFKPDRWIVAGEKGDEFDPSAGPQLAFGLGTRGCYGKRLVYLEMRIVLTLVIWNFELLPCPPSLSSYSSSLITTNEPKQCYDIAYKMGRIYKQNSPFTKDAASYALGVSEAMAFTVPVEKHRIKRKTLDPNFSKQRVSLMEDGLYEELEMVFRKIKEYEERDEEVPIMELYFCYTGDIISRYLFGKSLGLVTSPNFIERAEEMRSFTKGIWVAIHFQFIRYTLLALPRWVVAYLSDTWVKVLLFTENLAKEAILHFDMEKSLAKKPVDETIFDRLLTENARRQKKGQNARPLGFRELADESTGILNAGTEPTATMLSYATYFWIKFPHIQKPILDELATVELENGRLPLTKLETLPYFTGFVKESLRYMPLVPGRLPRTVPKGGLYVPSVKQTIPEGTVVGLDHLVVHFDPEIFDRPFEFLPERWAGEKGKELNHWLLSFSKGRTDCIGKTLAYAEMHLILANLFARFEVEGTPHVHEDMVWIDRVIVHSTRNLRIKVKGRDMKMQ